MVMALSDGAGAGLETVGWDEDGCAWLAGASPARDPATTMIGRRLFAYM
jgi:hypothetical protein